MDRSLASYEQPLLNRGHPYISESNRTKEDNEDIIYDAKATLKSRTHIPEQRFLQIYRDCMRFFTEQERLQHRQYMSGQKPPSDFYRDCGNHLKRNYPEMQNQHDFNEMMERIDVALFGYDVIQPLIDDPLTTDIKICGPYDIRVRIKGKAYRSNAEFLDSKDLDRFIDSLFLKNHIIPGEHPMLSFVDEHDENYLLRFMVSMPCINKASYPYLHIRKVSKQKPTFDDLIEVNMMNEDIKNYLIDRAKLSRGIVFAGPPGSGKTTALNAFIEYIPRTRETVVIQENDELYTEQSGFMFKHVSYGFQGEPVCTLEDLGKWALVEGCNEFIIGEVKGGEARYAMTLINAGGHAALTTHSNSAYETMDKLADLVKYGSSYTFEEARRMLKVFDTIVYLEDYKVHEILELRGYDDNTKQYLYTNIYRDI